MAKTGLKVKAARKPKFAVRGYTRCQRCGRPKAVYRKFGLCRICLREMAHRGRAARRHQVAPGNHHSQHDRYRSPRDAGAKPEWRKGRDRP